MSKIVFLDSQAYPFRDASYENEGVGGSEASLILLSRAMARRGLDVHVYLSTGPRELANGVHYHPLGDFRGDDGCDALVLFRHPFGVDAAKARVKVLWSTDGVLPVAEYASVVQSVEHIIGISAYHARLLRIWFREQGGKVSHLPLGVTLSDYAAPVAKVERQAIYCSVAGRGLPELLAVAPLIAQRVPGFTLVITSDYGLWRLPGHSLDVRAREAASKLPFVRYFGKLPRAELVKQQLASQVMAYPCTFEECFCISAMECMAAGAVPVTSLRGALPETIGPCGIQIPGFPGRQDFDPAFVEAATDLLLNDGHRGKLEALGRKKAAMHGWDQIAGMWASLLGL